MKFQISIFLILASPFLFAQNQSQTTTAFAGASTNINGLQANQEGTLINIQGTFSKILGLNILEFDDLIFAEASMEGSSLLFEDWNQTATFIASEKKYRVGGVNYDIRRKSFIAKISEDSLFTFDANLFNRAIVGNRTFITHGTNAQPNEVYELIFEGEDFLLVKKHSVKIKEGNPNPMLGQMRDKIIKQSTYYVLQNNHLRETRLSKKNVLGMLSREDKEIAQEYAKKYRRSFRDEQDLQQILNYVSNQS
ncbi:hypothetical protein [Altibacter sp. HG106]|uniref:hypothetical protein n=1 Tax=Altibacter sp. HG106 TaxID=3023937 RepID=UPI0023502408|nr:hypothetical protein [Altibacter sp. HG106]MDC7996021.1 hypothetical protein [Altibacter sp. HG106]